jgi:hypothetical protein
LGGSTLLTDAQERRRGWGIAKVIAAGRILHIAFKSTNVYHRLLR